MISPSFLHRRVFDSCVVMIGLFPIWFATPSFAASFEFDDLLRSDAFRSAPLTAPTLSDKLGADLLVILAAAQDALEDERFEDAERLARTVTDSAPDAPDGWYLLGLALANLDRIDDGLDALGQAGQLYKLNAEPFVIQGDLLLSVNRPEEAKVAFLSAVDRDPDNWRAQESLATMAEQDGDTDEAIQRYEKTLPNAPSDRSFPRMRLARQYLAAGRPQDAINVLTTYVDGNPSDPQALTVLGHLLLTNDAPDEAATSFSRAADLVPENPELPLLAAAAELAAGRMDDAKITLLAAKKRFPNSAEVYLELGALYGANRNYPAAIAEYEAGLQFDPDNPKLLKGASIALFRLGDFAGSKAQAEKLTERADASGQDFFWLGTVHEAAGENADAIRAYERATKLDDKNWIAMNNLAVLLTDDDPQRAVDLASQAAKLAPDVAAVQDTLGAALFEAGDQERADKVFSDSLLRDPDDVMATYRLGLVRLASGQKDSARQLLERALELDPDFQYSEETRKTLTEF